MRKNLFFRSLFCFCVWPRNDVHCLLRQETKMNFSESCSVSEMYNLSTYCLTHHDVGAKCVPAMGSMLRRMAGIWCILNGIVGFSGNLITLLAIPYASRHKRFVVKSESQNFFNVQILVIKLKGEARTGKRKWPNFKCCIKTFDKA